jgi:DNA-binding MarR family transcriptional regulator
MTERADLLVTLHPLTRALRRIEDDAAAQHGLTMWQYAILSVIGETPDLNQGEVARALQYSPNRIIADLDELQSRRLLERIAAADRRANLLRITTAGAVLQRRVQKRIRAREDELLTGLTLSQRRQFDTILGQLRGQLNDG